MIFKENAGLDYLNSLRNGTFKLGLGIDCDLDEHLRYKQTDLNVFAGHTNVGKTLGILFYFTCLALKHDLKFLVFSSENDIGSIKDDLISIYCQKVVSELDENEFQQAHYWINEHFKFVDYDNFFLENKRLMNFRDILKTAENLFTEFNFRFDSLVIDPYNSLGRVEEIKGNRHEYDYEVMAELRIWCKKEKKSVYILAHGNTEALRKVFTKEHDYAGYPIPLLSADIEGGGKFSNRCDNFVVIHRMTQHPSEWRRTEWHITKIKNTKTGGKPSFKNNPVIFESKKNMLSFNVYIRKDSFTPPTEWKDPLETKQESYTPKPMPLGTDSFQEEKNEFDWLDGEPGIDKF